MSTLADNLQELSNIKQSIKEAIRYQRQPVSDSDSFASYAEKIANINDIDIELQSKSLTVTENGTQTITPDTGYDGLSSVEVTTNIQLDGTVIEYGKTITGSLGNRIVIIKNIDLTNVTSMNSLFALSNLEEIKNITNTSSVTNMSSTFRGSKITTIQLFDTSSVTNMNECFYGCSKLTSIPLFNTSNVANMGYMFYNCSLLETIPLLNTSNVTIAYWMFSGCSALTSVPTLDLSLVNDAKCMFEKCTSLTETPLLNFSSLEVALQCFDYCSNLETINITETPLLRAAQNMFRGCTKLKRINGILNMIKITSNTNNGAMFGSGATSTTLLEEVRIKNFRGYGISNFSSLTNLSYDSLVYLIENLHTYTSGTHTLTLGATNLQKLTDAGYDYTTVAAAKHWTIA